MEMNQSHNQLLAWLILLGCIPHGLNIFCGLFGYNAFPMWLSLMGFLFLFPVVLSFIKKYYDKKELLIVNLIGVGWSAIGLLLFLLK